MTERRERSETGRSGLCRDALSFFRAGIRRAGFAPRRVENALILAGLGALYALETQTLGLFVPCPFHLITGLKCPACGITTAILALLRGEVRAAVKANLALALSLPVLGPYLLWVFVRWLRAEPVQDRGVTLVGTVLIAYFIVWGVLRNLAPLTELVQNLF